MSSDVTTSLTISSIMLSSLTPTMNCSISSLSYSFYSHFAVFGHSLSIHSWADSLVFLCNLWYCSYLIILLCHGLNLLLKSGKRPFVVLHFSFSSLVSVFIGCRPSQHKQFWITWTFFSLVNSYVQVSRMFMTTISKLISLTNLS